MNRLSDSEDRKRTGPPRQATIVHLFHGTLRDGEEITTLCGQDMTLDLDGTLEATGSGEYVVCALCEAAWQLADIPIPGQNRGPYGERIPRNHRRER